MSLKKEILCVFFLIVCNKVFCKQCHDCMKYTSCPAAVNLLRTRRDMYTRNKFQQAHCGFDYASNSYKVCCSDFEETSGSLTMTPVSSSQARATQNSDKLNLLPETCGSIDGRRIVGGQIARIYEFPWMALIAYREKRGISFSCGGSIINKRYILTAAHCIANNIIGIRLGDNDIRERIDCQGQDEDLVCESHIQDVGIEKYIVHEKYSSAAYRNDIALLRVDEDINFNYRNVKPICLPVTASLRTFNITGEQATVTGWGLTDTRRSSRQLMKVSFPIKSDEECRSYYNRMTSEGTVWNENVFCAGELGKDSCNGDSGGPLILEGKYNNVYSYVQYGIVSHGHSDCGNGVPNVNTDVRKYIDWILEKIEP